MMRRTRSTRAGRRKVLLHAVVIGGVLAAAVSAAAQRDQRDQTDRAIRRCEDELQFSMSREVGGRSPEAMIDYRRADVRPIARNEYDVSGIGRFTRDVNDRGRTFSYQCNVDMNSGRVRARYNWSRGDSDYDDRPGSGTLPYPPSNRPGGGFGGQYGPQGRLWFSGGIISRGSGKGLDVKDRSMRDEAPIQQWEFGGGANQQWNVIDVGRDEFVILSRSSNKVLEIADGSGADGALLIQNRWLNNANQRWRFERAGGFYQIINVNTGKCLDVKDQGMENGVPIQQWSCGGAPNQLWRLDRPDR